MDKHVETLQFRAHESKGLLLKMGRISRRVSDYVEVTGFVRQEGSPKLLIQIEFATVLGGRLTLRVAREDTLGRRQIIRELVGHGWRLPEEQDNQNMVETYIRNTIPEKIFLLPSHRGWCSEGPYITLDLRVIGQARNDGIILLPPKDDHKLTSVQGGSLEGWQEDVARPAIHSRRMMFAISAGFAAFLLKMTGIESGLFHFYGPSAIGKSLLLMAGQSVSQKSDRVLLQKWDVTKAGFEELGADYCDSLLTLDETGHLSIDPGEATKMAHDVGFKLTAGSSRTRSKFYDRQAGLKRMTWRLLVLSSGEHAFFEVAAKAGRRRIRGEEVRMIDIPAQASDKLGVFNSVPDGLTSKELAGKVESGCSAHFGHPGEAFLTALIEHITTAPDDIKAKIDRSMRIFMKKAGVPECSWELRFAERFGLAYAAAVLAIRFGVLPWSKPEALVAIVDTYLSARQSVPDAAQEMAGAWGRIRKRLERQKGFIDLRKRVRGTSSAKAFIKEDRNHGVYFAVPASTMQAWAGDDVSLACLGDYLRRIDALVTDDRDVPTRQVQIPGLAGRRRYYCIKALKGPETHDHKEDPL